MALALALATTGVAGVLVPAAGFAATPLQAATVPHFTIKSGNLAQALDALAKQSGLQVDYPPSLVAGKRTRGAYGQLSPEAALNRLLVGTGIASHRINATTFVLRPMNPPSDRDPARQAVPSSSTSSTKPKPQAKPSTLQTISVTGSLIPQSQVETAVPLIRLHVADLEKSGLGSIYAALHAQPLATGSVLGNQDSARGFTPGAETISLLGLNPDFTLYLINGHPITSYPLLYDGRSNFVDLSDIPMGMVDHIDIVPGNLSSIYGSSAIAGVVNIVLKHHMNGSELNVRGGDYTSGGGQNERFEFMGGYNTDKLSMIYGVQFSHQNPIFEYQRSITASSLANPDPSLRYGYATFMHQYLSPTYYPVYDDPGDACNAVSGLFRGTTKRWSQPHNGLPLDPASGAPTGPGYYCGTVDWAGYGTSLNKNRAGAGYLNVSYQFNQNAELYANVLYNVSMNRIMYGATYWESNEANGGLFWNGNTNRYETLWHEFAPEEYGNWHAVGAKYLERSYNAWGGLRGTFADSNLQYDLYYSRSQQTLDEDIPWLLADKVNAFFQKTVLGPELGTTSGYPIYDPNLANFYKPVTPAEYASMNGVQRDRSQTWVQSLNVHLSNSNLFKLPGGPAGFAAIFQYGSQSWSNPTDPRVIAGDFYDLTGTSGGGSRGFWAFGGEFRAPIFKMLTADLSARYDQYSNHDGGTDGRATYRLGLAFRPTSTLLIRGSYATAFRAPDMAYVFGGKSGNFPGGYTDYYRCDEYGGVLVDCPYYNNQSFFELHTGNRDLKSITAKSADFGVVWSPSSVFDVKADYYNVDIANEVELQSIDTLLKTEAACRTGQLDINSSTCVATLDQIERYPVNSPQAGGLEQVTALPINIASERVSGIVASLDYTLGLGNFGKLRFNANYNVTLKHTFTQDPGSQPVDLLRQPNLNPYSTEFKNIASASATWDIGKWGVTLYGIRYGSTPNYAAQYNGYGTDVSGFNGQPAGAVAPWMIYNGSVTYAINKQLTVSAIVNNIRNSMPPGDASYVDWPYFNSENYNPYGREVWLELDWKFGQH